MGYLHAELSILIKPCYLSGGILESVAIPHMLLNVYSRKLVNIRF